MKVYLSIIIGLILALVFSVYNYIYFEYLLSLAWSIASIFIIYSSIKYSTKYKFIQFNIKKMTNSILSINKKNNTPISSLCTSLAAKIGVGSLSGVALCLYYGGLGSIFWLVIISLFVAVNSYVETLIGIKYREKVNNNYFGGPSYYIKKCLNNKKLSHLYSILIIITYAGLFLSIQSNTIISTISSFKINKLIIAIILSLLTLIIILKGSTRISKINRILVPIMLLFYFLLGSYVLLFNRSNIIIILKETIKEGLNIKSIIPVFILGMEKAIFITESAVGTSAISSSNCQNNPEKQGMLEVFGIYIVVFLVCLTTFFIIATTNYTNQNFNNLNGIEIVLYAFNYHFGKYGIIFLTIITVLFAFSTIISSYLFGESNIKLFSQNKKIIKLYKILFIIIIFVSSYLKPILLWNLCDFFLALLTIINTYSLLIIVTKRYNM